MKPYRAAPLVKPPAAEPVTPEARLDEDTFVHALLFVVGAICASIPLIDPTQTTSGALGGLAMVVALWSFVHERALPRRAASIGLDGDAAERRDVSGRMP